MTSQSLRSVPASDPVRAQYERFPYPPREPADERGRLIRTGLDRLSRINAYCFAGRRDLTNGSFRVLVAGGGTGDSLIYLAEQLRGTGSELVYLDLSEASAKIAEERAQVRGLESIRFVHGSLLELDRLDLGHFDYINCSGVLHHLEDPAAGLAALTSALAPDGVIGLLIYAKYGRAGVYHLQDALRIMNRDQADDRARITVARRLLTALPETNWFARGPDVLDHVELGDAGVFDLLLHSRDRAYSVAELYDLLAAESLRPVGFELPARYEPAHLLDDALLLGRTMGLPARDRHHLAELMRGDIVRHVCYATRGRNSVASIDDLEQVPLIPAPEGTAHWARSIHEVLAARPGELVEITAGNGRITLTVPADAVHTAIFRHLDGSITLDELYARAGDDAEVREEGGDRARVEQAFRALYEQWSGVDQMLLAHCSVAARYTI